MGKGGAKTQVTEYYLSQHFGVCATPDAFKRIVIKEKDAWTGYITEPSKILIQEDNLFGGATKEGGATGTIYFLPGLPDQLLYDELATRLGRSGGADAPGYRGIGSVFFTGRPDANKGAKGFYWSANNPYLPGVWVEVERAPKGLDPTYAMIPRPGFDQFPSGVLTGGVQLAFGGWTPDQTILILTSGSSNIQIWDMATLTLLSSAAPADTINGIIAVRDDGSFYCGQTGSGATGVSLVDATTGQITELSSSTMAGGIWSVTEGVFGVNATLNNNLLQLVGSSVVATAVGFRAGRVFDNADGTSWAGGGVTSGGSYTSGLGICDCATKTAHIVTTGLTGGGLGFDNGNGQWFFWQDDHIMLVNQTTYAIDAGPVASAAFAGSGPLSFRAARPGDQSIWIGNKLYSSADLSVLQTITASDWSTGTSFDSPMFAPSINAFLSKAITESGVTVRYLNAGVLDANPAHIVYEALTNTDWGMGSPTTLIDTASFEDAGVTLYNEPLGISLLWTRQAAIQDFIQEALNHANAVLYTDPQTGLLTFKLIRGDYDPDTLPVIDPSTANLTNFGRKLWGDIPNEMNVTWTNPENEQEETVTEQDLASITTQGGIVSDSRNYYGARYADLAKYLARRELRSAGAPLASMKAEVDRSYYYLRPASVLKLNWPEYGLSEIVCRVAGIDYGKPGDAAIKLDLVEDVFGLDIGDYTSPPSTAWVSPSQSPTAMDDGAAFTLPYFFAANALTSIVDAQYPEVLAGVLAASSNIDAQQYELQGEVAQPDGSAAWEALATLNILGYAELAADIVAEASSAGVTFDNFVGSLTPDIGGFALFGADNEATSEIVMVTASGYSLSRGVLDTVPKAWAAGTPVWFFDIDTLFEDPTARSVSEVVDYKLLTRTSLGQLSLAAAPLVTATLSDRPWLPSRPAKVTIGATEFNDLSTPVNQIGIDPIVVSWATRNRLTEDSQVLGWDDATVTPESGQTTTVTVLKTDLTTVLATHSGLSGTSYNIAASDFGGEAIGYVKVTSERIDADGTFESLQGQGLYVQIDVIAPVGMATETDAALALAAAQGSGVASETDTAFALSSTNVRAVGMASESDTALALLSAFDPASLFASGEVGDYWVFNRTHTNAASSGANMTTATGLVNGHVMTNTTGTPVLDVVSGVDCVQTTSAALSYTFGSDVSQPGTIVVALVDTTTTAAQNYISGSSSLKRWQVSQASGAPGNVIMFAGSTLNSGINTLAASPSETWIAEFNGASSIFYANGVQTGTGNAGTQVTNQVRVGANFDGTGAGTLRTFALLFINRILTSTEKSQVATLFAPFTGLS